MTINPKRHGEQINTLVQVWTALNPAGSYSGLSLQELRTGFQASLDARARISAAQAELAAAIRGRQTADEASFKFYKRALSAIKADAHAGEDGPMFKAVSSETRRARRSGAVPVAGTSLTAPSIL